MKPVVAIIMGSDSDLPIMQEAAAVLKSSGIAFELNVFSAHRTPDLLRRYLAQAERRGVEVFIAGAGGAAHLPGVIAAHTTRPVIGVPIDSALKGVDSLLSIVQMPKGIPVATVAIGKAGAANAAIFAIEILRLKYPELAAKLTALRKALKERVLAANRRLHRGSSRD
jgi:5-(carboxyamino)imidazole ribonucleotide mutase